MLLGFVGFCCAVWFCWVCCAVGSVVLLGLLCCWVLLGFAVLLGIAVLLGFVGLLYC